MPSLVVSFLKMISIVPSFVFDSLLFWFEPTSILSNLLLEIKFFIFKETLTSLKFRLLWLNKVIIGTSKICVVSFILNENCCVLGTKIEEFSSLELFTKCERKAPKFIYGDISSLKNNDSISLFFIVLYF